MTDKTIALLQRQLMDIHQQRERIQEQIARMQDDVERFDVHLTDMAAAIRDLNGDPSIEACKEAIDAETRRMARPASVFQGYIGEQTERLTGDPR